MAPERPPDQAVSGDILVFDLTASLRALSFRLLVAMAISWNLSVPCNVGGTSSFPRCCAGMEHVFLQSCQRCGRWPMSFTEEIFGYPRQLTFACGCCRAVMTVTMRKKLHDKQTDPSPTGPTKRLSKGARVPDESEIVTTDAERRIRDLKEEAGIE